MSEPRVHVLHIRNSVAGSFEPEGVDEFNIRSYLVQCGFTVTNVAMKPSGHVFVTATGSEKDMLAAWEFYEPSKVNPATDFVEQMLHLKAIVPRLRSGTATVPEKDKALATIIQLALKAYGVADT